MTRQTLTISAPRISNSIPLPDSLTVGNSTDRFSQSSKYLGVTHDMHLTMTAHVVNLIRTANFEMCCINSIRHYLSVQATKTLVSAFVLSWLDYCNSLLSGCPQYHLNRLQKVQNNAAHLILKVPKADHITPHLRTLHWLPIDARIKYKLCSLCFGAITSTGPVYLSDLLKIDTTSRQLRSSADIHILCTPSVNTKSYSERSFSYTAPTLWNTLPKGITFSQSVFSPVDTRLFPT